MLWCGVCCFTAASQLLRCCCFTAVPLLLHYCFTAASLLFHCCFTTVSPLLHFCFTSASMLLYCCFTATTMLFHCCFTAASMLLHSCFVAAAAASLRSNLPILSSARDNFVANWHTDRLVLRAAMRTVLQAELGEIIQLHDFENQIRSLVKK